MGITKVWWGMAMIMSLAKGWLGSGQIWAVMHVQFDQDHNSYLVVVIDGSGEVVGVVGRVFVPIEEWC